MINIVKRLILVIGLSAMIMIVDSSKALAADKFNVYSDKTVNYKGKTSNLTKIGTFVKGSGGSIGKYPTRKGVILVTSTGSIAGVVGHSAIIYTSSTVIEATSSGIVVGKNNWNTSKSSVAAVTVRDTTTQQDSTVARWCYKKVGTRYNYNYYNTSTRSSFYCSHIIWAGYKDNYGINLNTEAYDIAGCKAVGPFEFVRTSASDMFITYMKKWDKNDVTD